METLKNPSYASEQNPSPKQEDPPLLFHFPSQFYDEHELPVNNHIMFQDQLLYVGNDHKNHDQTTRSNLFRQEKKVDPHPQQNPSVSRRRNLGVIPRRRAGKKDRHSKICTAQGIRDRRMRLSLQVARKFFDLQDMLGYDKASKTIEWLFAKSKMAIKELTKIHPHQANYNMCNSDARSESFMSECEVVSGIEESSNKDMKESVILDPEAKTPERLAACKSNSKESREKARERARCRTREKMMIRFSGQWCDSNPNPNEELGFSNTPFESMDQDLLQERILTYGADYNTSVEHQSADAGTIEKLLGIPTSSASSYVDPSTSFMGFLGSWEQVTLTGNPSSIYSAIP